MRFPDDAARPTAPPRAGLALPELVWLFLKIGATAVGDTGRSWR
jgi:hypothetical protein